MDVKFTNVNENEYEVYADNKKVGFFRFFPMITYKDELLTNFLGYIEIDKEYRNKGILKKIIYDFDVRNLMIDDVKDVPISALQEIYMRLGFRFEVGSKAFMVKE